MAQIMTGNTIPRLGREQNVFYMS